MTDKLLCPFCQQELGLKNINNIMCSNEKCVAWKGNFYGSEDLWQALIDTKKKLDVAVDALDRMAIYDSIYDIIARNAIKRINEIKGGK